MLVLTQQDVLYKKNVKTTAWHFLINKIQRHLLSFSDGHTLNSDIILKLRQRFIKTNAKYKWHFTYTSIEMSDWNRKSKKPLVCANQLLISLRITCKYRANTLTFLLRQRNIIITLKHLLTQYGPQNGTASSKNLKFNININILYGLET